MWFLTSFSSKQSLVSDFFFFCQLFFCDFMGNNWIYCWASESILVIVRLKPFWNFSKSPWVNSDDSRVFFTAPKIEFRTGPNFRRSEISSKFWPFLFRMFNSWNFEIFLRELSKKYIFSDEIFELPNLYCFQDWSQNEECHCQMREGELL